MSSGNKNGKKLVKHQAWGDHEWEPENDVKLGKDEPKSLDNVPLEEIDPKLLFDGIPQKNDGSEIMANISEKARGLELSEMIKFLGGIVSGIHGLIAAGVTKRVTDITGNTSDAQQQIIAFDPLIAAADAFTLGEAEGKKSLDKAIGDLKNNRAEALDSITKFLASVMGVVQKQPVLPKPNGNVVGKKEVPRREIQTYAAASGVASNYAPPSQPSRSKPRDYEVDEWGVITSRAEKVSQISTGSAIVFVAELGVPVVVFKQLVLNMDPASIIPNAERLRYGMRCKDPQTCEYKSSCTFYHDPVFGSRNASRSRNLSSSYVKTIISKVATVDALADNRVDISKEVFIRDLAQLVGTLHHRLMHALVLYYDDIVKK